MVTTVFYSLKRWKVIQKYSYLLHWICYNQRFEIQKNWKCKSFIPYYQQNEWSFDTSSCKWKQRNNKKI